MPQSHPSASTLDRLALHALARALLLLPQISMTMTMPIDFENLTSSKGSYTTTILSLKLGIVAVTPWSNLPASIVDQLPDGQPYYVLMPLRHLRQQRHGTRNR